MAFADYGKRPSSSRTTSTSSRRRYPKSASTGRRASPFMCGIDSSSAARRWRHSATARATSSTPKPTRIGRSEFGRIQRLHGLPCHDAAREPAVA
eukprot:1863002-Pleurochrysis_carterae.AAC.1